MSSSPRLPTEICEYIIDTCANQFSILPHLRRGFLPRIRPRTPFYQTLGACSLTCRSWLSRSRFHIYSLVTFSHYDQVLPFLTTIT
ncbi:hypothetical protein OH77DRAFT_1414220, partial [Trametes cingulata]